MTIFPDLLPKLAPMRKFMKKMGQKKSREDVKKNRCSYCKNIGHLKEDCRKLVAKTTKNGKNMQSPPSTGTTRPTFVTRSSISCYGYGYGHPGYIRLKYPTCTSCTETSFSSVIGNRYSRYERYRYHRHCYQIKCCRATVV